MTDLTMPGEVDAEIDNTAAAHSWANLGGGAWIVDGSDLAPLYSALDETVLNGFAYNSTDTSGLDVVIDPGEAYVAGWLCRDTQTTVTLPSSSTTTVYLGYDASAVLGSGEAAADSQNIIVGLDGDFASEDPQIPIHTFDTDSTGVTGHTSHRVRRKPVTFDHKNVKTNMWSDLDVKGDLSVAGAPVLYREQDWDGNSVVYKTSDGDTLELIRE